MADTMSSFGDTVQAIENELATLRNDPSDYARLRRITLNDALADAMYGLSDLLKRHGHDRDADEAHSRANKHWSRVCADVGPNDPGPDDGRSPLTPQRAADMLRRSRGEI